MGLGLGIMPRMRRLYGRLVLKPIRRAWHTKVNSQGKVALGEPLNPDGTSQFLPADWIFVDWKEADHIIDLVKTPNLPFVDHTQKLIYSAHLIEHLPQATLEVLLRECWRVLEPGGQIRLECPDAQSLIDLYRKSDEHMLSHFRNFRRQVIVDRHGFDEKYLEDHLSLLGEISNYIIPGLDFHMPVYAERAEFEEKLNNLDIEDFAAWCFSLQTPEQRQSGGHQNVLYFSKLKTLLEEAGFSDVVAADFDFTSIPELRLNEDGPDGVRAKAHRRFYSLYVEATKPRKSLEFAHERDSRSRPPAGANDAQQRSVAGGPRHLAS